MIPGMLLPVHKPSINTELLDACAAALNQDDENNDGQNAGDNLNSGSAHDEFPFFLQ
jgi:hypothetical protein